MGLPLMRQNLTSPVVKQNVAGIQQRAYTSGYAPFTLDSYSSGLRWSHWLAGGGMLATVGFVKQAQWTDDKELKGKYMLWHKSTALVTIGLLVPRLFYRMTSAVPGPLPGSAVEHMLAKLSHWAFYAGMMFLPASGVAMGYYGGKGLPFYGWYTIPGAETPNKYIAGTSFKYHKLVGQAFEYLIPLHIGAVALHTIRGHGILSRINPLSA